MEIFIKKIYLVFCPTKETLINLNKLKIFERSKIKYLPDPVINPDEINILKNKKIKKPFMDNDYFLIIGRFTKQKNHSLIFETIKKFNLKENFLFIGEGELKSSIIDQIQKLNLEKKLNY